jgi:hypothetical protein
LIKTYTSTGDLEYSLCFLICRSEERINRKLIEGLGKNLGDRKVAENRNIKTAFVGLGKNLNRFYAGNRLIGLIIPVISWTPTIPQDM